MMAIVNFPKEGKQVEVKVGTRLVEAIRKCELSLETPCNCVGLCGKCKVKAVGKLSKVSKEEADLIKDENIRLACIAEVLGDVQVEFLEGYKTLKTINRGYSIKVKCNNKIKYKYNDKKILCGVAFDIGTTGLSAYLMNLRNGEVLNKISALNPQTEYGGDVISRITFCMEGENGVEILSNAIRKKLNDIVGELLVDYIKRQDIYVVTVAANTTMLHLLAGENPESIAKAPYAAVFLDKKEKVAKEMGLEINEEGRVILLPSASAYVGADIISGIVATDFINKNNNSIFIDIGTNGEIVVNAKGALVASSTAAGPALEGMNISCGLRAIEGAIDKFHIDEEYNIYHTTINAEKALGICGSGLLDIAAAFVKAGVVENSGRFNAKMNDKLKDKLKDKKFYITEEIYVSQKDIRQIQLAKGAIAAGITMLLKELNIKIEEIDEVVIAGAFGYHVDAESIKTIGLIPKGFNGEVAFVGNSSVEGAAISAINDEILNKMIDIKEKLKVVELSTKEDFQEYFIKELNF